MCSFSLHNVKLLRCVAPFAKINGDVVVVDLYRSPQDLDLLLDAGELEHLWAHLVRDVVDRCCLVDHHPSWLSKLEERPALVRLQFHRNLEGLERIRYEFPALQQLIGQDILRMLGRAVHIAGLWCPTQFL